MRKKYVSLMLIFTILFSTFMPALTSLATEEPIVINEIRITSETTSVTAGVLPEFSASTTTDGLSIEGYGSNTGWVMRGPSNWYGFGSATPTATADGTHYGLRLSLQTTTGYAISGSATIYFNGTDITHQEYTELDTNYGYLYIDLGTAAETTTNTVINPINVTGFTAPVANAQANVSSIGLSEGLTITNTSDKHAYWLLADSPFTELASTDTFEAGTSYILYIPYTVNSGYEVADPESVAIGGTAVTSANKGYCTAGEIRLIYTATAASAPVTESSGFTVTFDVGEYSTTVVPSQNWDEPHLVVAPDVEPTSSTHDFDYWYKDDANTPYEFGETLESENMTLHAHWTEKSTVTPPGPTMWTVNFDIGESKTVIPNQNVANGLHATIPDETPILDGWTFVRWCEDSTRNTAFDFENVAIEKNTTVYAKYVKNVTVTIDVNGGNPLTKTKCTGTAGQTLAEILGELMSITPSHPDGKVLVGLNDVDGDGNETPLNMSGIEDMEVTEDMTLKFVWGDAITSLDFTVTLPTAGTTTNTPKDEYNDYIWDEQTNKPVVAIPTGVHYALNGDPCAYWVSGYEEAQIVIPFIGTFEAGNRYNIHTFLTIDDGYAMAEDCTITLNGEETEKIIIAEGLDPETGAHILEVGLNVEVLPTYKVTFHPNGGSVSPTTKEYQEGAKLGTLPVPTRSGYGFVGWYQSILPARAYAYFRDYYGYDIIRITPHNDINNHNYTHYFRYGDVVYFDVTVNDATVTGLDLNDENTNQYVVSNDGHNIKGYIHLTESAFSRVGSYVLDFVDIHVSNPTYSYIVNDFAVYQNKATSETTVGTGDMVLYAGWTPGASTVSFDTDGGSEIAPQAVKTGAYATRPTEKPVKDGYKFEDWYVDSDFSARFDFSTAITKDTVVYARYIKLIKEVNIIAELPKLGETITKEGSKQVPQLVLTVDGEGYRMPETETGLMMYWLDPAGEGLADGLEIEPETGYQVVLFALANKGYAFADDVVVKINGVATTVFDMGEANEGMEILATITTDSLKIIGGKDQTHIKGTSEGLTITCNGGFRQFRGLRVGTTELDASAFDSGAGSTIVTLKPDYLNSLELGTYQISFLYQGDRECSTNFTIAKANEPAQGGGGGGQTSAPAATNSPVTGDTITVWILVMTMSGLAMIGIIYNLRRKNR